MQGVGQAKILWNAQPLEDVFNDPNTPDSLKTKIELIQSVKAYAKEIGLKVNDSYTKIYDQKGMPVLWNVSACEPFAFQSYEWEFPFLGSFGYKGFFELESAKKEAKRLKELGLDTRIRTVGAWSTLGWFNDPILSNQLYRSEGDLAETILHELTHATIFFQDSLTFNENVASFIGSKATLGFLANYFGDSSQQLISYVQSEEDAARFRIHFLSGKDTLERLYTSFDENQPDSIKYALKQSLIRSIIQSLDTISFYEQDYSHLFDDRSLPNNAYFMGFNRYYSDQPFFEQLLMENNNELPQLIRFLKASTD